MNTEARLDPEHFLDLLAYRPFWEEPPGDDVPKVFARTTEGSITTNQLYIRREAGVRGTIAPGSFWGYQLRQLDDLEQRYFFQYFETQGPLKGPLHWRILGQPTSRKQDADIGLGSLLKTDRSELLAQWLFVDFLFSEKNVNQEADRRKHYNGLLRYQHRWTDGGLETTVEWDTPVEREHLAEGTRFGHRALDTRMRAAWRRWEGALGWNRQHRTLDHLAGGARLQNFRKDVWNAEATRRGSWEKRSVRVGAGVQRRRAAYDRYPETAQSFHQQRWEVDLSIGCFWPLSRRTSLDTTVYQGLIWEKTRWGVMDPAQNDFSLQSKARTLFRIDFTPAVSLVVSPTWDLDKALSGQPRNGFDGGNIQFQARL